MIRPVLLTGAALLLAAAPVLAQDSLRDRLRALGQPAPAAPADLYESEKNEDIRRIEGDAARLFGPDRRAAIALFTGPDCTACRETGADLAAIAATHGLHVTVLDTANPDNAALMARMTLDILPSYVMPDRLIRGHLPAFVLERYLTR